MEEVLTQISRVESQTQSGSQEHELYNDQTYAEDNHQRSESPIQLYQRHRDGPTEVTPITQEERYGRLSTQSLSARSCISISDDEEPEQGEVWVDSSSFKGAKEAGPIQQHSNDATVAPNKRHSTHTSLTTDETTDHQEQAIRLPSTNSPSPPPSPESASATKTHAPSAVGLIPPGASTRQGGQGQANPEDEVLEQSVQPLEGFTEYQPGSEAPAVVEPILDSEQDNAPFSSNGRTLPENNTVPSDRAHLSRSPSHSSLSSPASSPPLSDYSELPQAGDTEKSHKSPDTEGEDAIEDNMGYDHPAFGESDSDRLKTTTTQTSAAQSEQLNGSVSSILTERPRRGGRRRHPETVRTIPSEGTLHEGQKENEMPTQPRRRKRGRPSRREAEQLASQRLSDSAGQSSANPGQSTAPPAKPQRMDASSRKAKSHQHKSSTTVESTLPKRGRPRKRPRAPSPPRESRPRGRPRVSTTVVADSDSWDESAQSDGEDESPNLDDGNHSSEAHDINKEEVNSIKTRLRTASSKSQTSHASSHGRRTSARLAHRPKLVMLEHNTDSENDGNVSDDMLHAQDTTDIAVPNTRSRKLEPQKSGEKVKETDTSSRLKGRRKNEKSYENLDHLQDDQKDVRRIPSEKQKDRAVIAVVEISPPRRLSSSSHFANDTNIEEAQQLSEKRDEDIPVSETEHGLELEENGPELEGNELEGNSLELEENSPFDAHFDQIDNTHPPDDLSRLHRLYRQYGHWNPSTNRPQRPRQWSRTFVLGTALPLPDE
ncbi:hypothetical protein BGW42_003036 [Actinomortierella wolfii]|nr:hypothetical protein BGW42_003036 [Actinomortierella wolfii]